MAHLPRRTMLIGGVLAASCSSADTDPGGQFVRKLPNRWKRSRDYTLAVFRRMPQEHLHFRPTEDVWTFAQQLTHIADGNFLMAGPLWGEERQFVGEPRDLEADDLLRHLEASFAYVLEAFQALQDGGMDEGLEFMGNQEPRWELTYRILDHVSHHRGQALVYLRLKGVEPPPYPG